MNSLYKKILFFAFPVALSNISVPLLGIVDTAVLGHLHSSVFISGVALGAELFFFITWIFGFLRMGTTSVTAPAYGAGNHQQVRDILVQGLFISFVIGLFLILISAPVLFIAERFYGATPDVLVQMRIFFWIRIFSAPASLANMVILGWLLGLQQAKAPLILVLFTNIVNIILDLWFVIGLKFYTSGVAYGSLIATFWALILSFFLVYRVQHQLSGTFRFRSVIRWQKIKKLLKVNQQLFVRTLCLLLVFLTISAWGAREGTDVLAANTLLLNLLTLSACFLDGIANAAEAKIGETTGKHDVNKFYSLLKVTGICSFIMIALCSFVLWAGSTTFISMMTSLENVRYIASHYYIWLIILPLAAGCGYWLDGVFIGLGRTDLMQYGILFSVVFIFIPAVLLMRPYGNEGIWITLILFMAMRSLSMVFMLQRWGIPKFLKQNNAEY